MVHLERGKELLRVLLTRKDLTAPWPTAWADRQSARRCLSLHRPMVRAVRCERRGLRRTTTSRCLALRTLHHVALAQRILRLRRCERRRPWVPQLPVNRSSTSSCVLRHARAPSNLRGATRFLLTSLLHASLGKRRWSTAKIGGGAILLSTGCQA